MNMQTRIERLEKRAEDAAVTRMAEECDLTLLTDDELISLEACFSEAIAPSTTIKPTQQPPAALSVVPVL